MPNLKPHGPKNAPICIVTDAPEKADIICGKFFSGQSGVRLRDWMRRAGVNPENIRYESVAFSITTVPGEWAGKVWGLRNRIREYKAYVFVSVGNIASFALTHEGKAPKELANAFDVSLGSLNDITKIRGGVYPIIGQDIKCLQRKVIPCIHPKEVLKCGYKPNYEKRCRADWVFIAEEAKTLDIVRRKENFYYEGDKKRTIDACTSMIRGNSPITIDIETWTGKIDCVGFADSPENAVVVPIMPENSKWSLGLIKTMCECPLEKVLQNGLYDAYWLKRTLGIDIKNYKWDTLGMHHCLDAAEEHKLNFLASIYTYPRVNYWKDSFKKSLLMNAAYAQEELHRYNCKDTTLTWEIFKVLEEKLLSENMMDFYHKHYQALFSPFLSMMLLGMRVDTVAQEGYRRKLKEESERIRKRLSLLAGFDVYTKKGFSPIAIRELLLGVLGLRVVKKFGEETFDENALLLMQQREPEKCGDVIRLILRHRTIGKEIAYLKGYDFDGRVRCEYTYRTDSGRASSRSNPMGTGFNLQNVKR
jgi:uracil-DNA glycosylase